MQDTGKLLFSQSSGFNTFDKHFATAQLPLRIDQMITLSVYNSQSGTIKKMLHGPSLKIYCVKEVPLANREARRILKEWLQIWQELQSQQEFYLKVHETFWNSPEGCVSVVEDCAKTSLQNLVDHIGALPEKTLQNLSKQVLKGLEHLHSEGITHGNISCSQILFDRRGKVKLSPGFGHILKSK